MKYKISKISLIGIPILVLALASCDESRTTLPKQVDGWAPIYATGEETSIIAVDPKTTEKGGKIYVKGTTLYQLEGGKGVHVIDISQPDNPQKIKFITIAGAQEIAIKNNYLYANSMNDLVVVDISNISDVKEVTRTTDVFHMIDQDVPPTEGYFECVDASKGKVIGWEQKVIQNPKCIRN